MSDATKAFDRLTRAYAYKSMAKDVSRAVQKAWKKRDDANYFLHKVGLARHQPGKSAFGVAGAFLLGAVGGGLIALVLAPMRGAEIRSEIKKRTSDMIGASKKVLEPLGAQA